MKMQLQFFFELLFFSVSTLKKYNNDIFILLGNFPSKIYFHMKVQEIK